MTTSNGRSADSRRSGRSVSQWLLGLLIVLALAASILMVFTDRLSITGSLRVSFLLPSLLGALLSLWLVSDLARRLWSPRHSLYALAALFCTLQFGLMAKRAQIDMVLVAMTTLSLWGLLRHLLRGPDWQYTA